MLKIRWAARHLGSISSVDLLDSKEQHSQMFTHTIPNRPKEIISRINMSSFLKTVIRGKGAEKYLAEVSKCYGKN